MIFVKIDGEALQHLDPSMDPLTDADSSSTVLRKGKGALEYLHRQLSDILFGDNIPHAGIPIITPQPSVSVTIDSAPLTSIQIYRLLLEAAYCTVAREPSIAVVKLTSESQPVKNYLVFHAVEDVDEEHRAAVIHDTFVSEDRMEAWKAEVKAQAQTQAQTQAED